ncbi:MAG TPA: glycosyltransferase family 39 protein [Fimbriimonadaceae bacterium]|nr:glycosyltransferase family 39 protein [Fimbriimonadaceae bacterium]
MKLSKTTLLAVILALVHLGLALPYSSVTPYRQAGVLKFQGGASSQDIGAPDERQHVNYIGHIIDRGLPVFDPEDENLYETYQFHQPPLFYWLGQGWCEFVFKVDPREASSKLAVRSLNSIIGALGVLGIFCLGLWASNRQSVGLASAAFAGLLPMNLALSGAVSNDPLLICLSAWALAFMVRGLRYGWSFGWALVCGLTIGLALVTKSSAIALLFPALITLIASLPKNKLVLIALPAAIGPPIALWARNFQLYGDPLAMNVFTKAFVGTAQAADFIRELGPFGYWTGINQFGLGVGWWTARSFLGAFGYMDIFYPSWLVGVFWLLLIVGLVFALAKPVTDESKKVRLAMFVFGLSVLALFLRFNAQYFQAQARYLFPALPVIAVGFAFGWSRILGRRHAFLPWILIGGLVLLNIVTLTWLGDEFAMRVR